MDKVEQNIGLRIKKTAFLPFSLLYGLGVGVRNMLFDLGILKQQRFDVPVISVGNITAGGTGKTPMVILLAEYFQAQGKKVAVLSRGYGRKSKGFFWVDLNMRWELFGDEPCLMQWKLQGKCMVAVDEKRVRGIETILKQNPEIDLIVLDDAFQHRYVKPKINILLCNYNRPFFKDFLIPSGLLREWSRGAKRADAVVVTKCPEVFSLKEKEEFKQALKKYISNKTPIYFSSIGYGNLLPLFEGIEMHSKPGLAMVVTGIANPKPLYGYLQKKGWDLQALAYPDHYHFEERHIHRIVQEWQKMERKADIITTEKDGVRLREFHMLKNIRVFTLPIEIIIEDWQGFEQFLNKQLSNS